jgi:2-oxoglutarate ferredoxin oxidoreductase subunit alpha
VLSDEELAALPRFERYRDVDGDGIPFRTLPGSKDPKGVYFTRGSGHDEAARYTEKPDEYKRGMDRLAAKYETARTLVPPPIVEGQGRRAGIIAYGTSHWAVVEARDQLRQESGFETDYLLLKALPFTDAVAEFVARHERIYVVEQNRDAQMAGLLRMEYPEHAGRIRPVLHYDGLPIDARSVSGPIAAEETLNAMTGATEAVTR